MNALLNDKPCGVPGCKSPAALLLGGHMAFCGEHMEVWSISPEARTPCPAHVSVGTHTRSMLVSFANRVSAEARNGQKPPLHKTLAASPIARVAQRVTRERDE